jgi:DNA-binding transcriptional ArsR family regulator
MIDPKIEQEVYLLHERVCPALGDPKRLLILYALAEGPLCVNELVEVLQVSQPTVSRHLRVLRERGLVNTERQGTAIYYSLADKRLIQAVDLLREVLEAQMAADADIAKALA